MSAVPVRLGVTPQSGADFELFLDWCDAAGRAVGDADVGALAEFAVFTGGAAKTRRRRLRHVLRHLSAVGVTVDDPDGAPGRPVWQPPDLAAGLDTVEGAVAACPVTGWPDGLRGRRDAFLIVLGGGLGLARAQMRQVSPRSVIFDGETVTVGGRRVAGSDDPVSCLVCAVGRWVDLWALMLDSRGKAREVLMLARSGSITAAHLHQPGRIVPEWVTMLPAIDQHGWADPDTPLSTKSVSRILHTRQRTDSRPPPAAEPDAPTRATTMYSDLTWDETDEVLDRICAEADAVLARVKKALTIAPIPRR